MSKRKWEKSNVKITNLGAVCFDCARNAGFVPKDKAFGVWMDECGICHKQKPCTDLHHDWKKKGTEK